MPKQIKKVTSETIGNIEVQYYDIYNNEVTTERKENLKNELAKIESNEGKIHYLKKEKLEYLQNITPEILEVSGSTLVRWEKDSCELFYDRYLQFEIEKIQLEIDNIEGAIKKNEEISINNNSNSTLKSTLSQPEIKKLHRLLLEKNYIKNIDLTDFIHWLTDKPLIKNVPKIRWDQSKGKAIQLFKEVCIGFNYTLLNNCVDGNGKKFDSNNKSKNGYAEIDDILNQIKR